MSYYLTLYRFKKCVRMIRIKKLVCPHESDEVLSVAEIDDIMRPAGDHVNGFDLVTAELKTDFFVRMDIALFDQRMTADDDKELPLGIMPMLTLGDAGFRDIHTELTVISGFQKLGEGAAIIAVHLERELEVLRRQVAQIQTVELFRKAAVGNTWDDQRIMLCLELLQQIDNLAKRDGIGQRDVAIASF